MNDMVQDEQRAARLRLARSRIMYSDANSGRSLCFRELTFRSIGGRGTKANYLDVESGVQYWISGPRRDRDDRLCGGSRGV